MTKIKFTDLLGKTFKEVLNLGDDRLVFITDTERYELYHRDECCEQVYIDDIVGDLEGLVGSPILVAEESTSEENPKRPVEGDDSFLWTFYKLATVKGWVDIKFYGTSNGYYSETAELYLVN